MKKLFSSGLFFLTTISVFSQAGMLDPTFGVGGKVITVCPGFSSNANSLVVQPDGKIVAGGNFNFNNDGYAIFIRYNTDGTFDTTFNQTGIDTFCTSTSSFLLYHPCKIAIQQDGKIIGPSSGMVRINTDGSLDSSFGINGRSTDYRGKSIALVPDGKIVQAWDDPDDHFTIRRYTADGNIDSSFGTNGYYRTIYFNSYDMSEARDLIVRPDYSIVAVGECGNSDYSVTDYALEEFDSNSTSHSGQCVLMPLLNEFNAIARYPDGTYVTGGKDNDYVNLVVSSRGGAMHVPGFSAIIALALTPDNKIIVGGGIAGDFALARLNENVSLDSSFGISGILTTDFDSASMDLISSLTVQQDGKIIAGGSSDGNVALARYTTCGAILNKVMPCGVLCNGAVSVTPFGKPPYSYLWSTGDTTSMIDSLCGGSYSVSITDST